MSHSPNRLADELARVMSGAMGLAQGVQREADGFVKGQIERILRDADVVSREEFEAVREMAILARDENEKLNARIVALEARLTS